MICTWTISWNSPEKGRDAFFKRILERPQHFGLTCDLGPSWVFPGIEEEIGYESEDGFFEKTSFVDSCFVINPERHRHEQYLVVYKDTLGLQLKLPGKITKKARLIGGDYIIEARYIENDSLRFRQRIRVIKFIDPSTHI
mgnify:CR=1 FL=1|jgi:hypothetical protein